MKTHFFISRLKKIVLKGLCVLTSETSCSSDFEKPLGWGTTFRELKVLSKMPPFRKSCYWGGGPPSGSSGGCQKWWLFRKSCHWGGGPPSGSLGCCQKWHLVFKFWNWRFWMQFWRKSSKISNIKKTRSAILCKKRCLTAPHHFSRPHWWKKRW